MPPDKPVSSTWSLAQRALACSKPRCRTLEQINVIAEMLTHLAIFVGVEREELLAVAYFIEAKHSEAGECVLSKGQPLEQWCLLLHGSALLTRYSAQRGSEQATTPLGFNDSWSEAALLHTTHPRRSSVTVVAGPQGCMTLRLRYSDYDVMNDMRNSLQLLPPEGTQGPPVEITVTQCRASAMALLCCFLRRLASARTADDRTPEEASELEPFLSSLPAYRSYPPELVACLAAACRSLSLPAGSMVYEHSTLADAHVTVLSGEVQLRKFGGQPGAGGEEGESDSAGTASAPVGTSGSGGAVGTVRPAPPPGQPQDSSGDGPGGRLNIRARLRREREARKLMQKQLDEYVSRLDSDAAGAESNGNSATPVAIKDPVSASPVDWTRVFMQKAMRTVEPIWKALHPADKAPRRRPGGADNSLDAHLDGSEGPVTEVAQLLGPAAAKAYYRGLQSQGYSDSEPPSPSGSSGSAGTRPGDAGVVAARDKWKRWMFSVDGPETDHQRTLRSMAMRASRINRERHARSRGPDSFDAEEMEEMYGPQFASLSRGSPVGELSTVMLHTAMRKESAIAGPGGCELLLVDWEAYQQGVLAARIAVLVRAAPFLASLPKDQLSRLAELCLCLSVERATLLARQGTALECMVVVQDGEVTLLHEPSAALHTRIATIRGLAVSRSRNGRTQLVPLLSTLSTANLPVPIAGGSGASIAVPPSTPAPSGGSFTGATTPVEITLHGLLLGEVGVGGILGEAILGSRGGGPGGGSGTSGTTQANGHSDPSQQGQGQGHGHGTGHGAGSDAHQHQPITSMSPALPAEGPKWPTTVLATRASVLLVIPRSVLYMSEFDFMRIDLMKFATERRAWLARRVEAAYRAAAAPATTPAVFTSTASQSPSAPAPLQQSHPLLRRPVLQGTAADGGDSGGGGTAIPTHVGSFPRRAASSDVSGSSGAESGGLGTSNTHYPISRRRSVESLQRSSSPGNPSAAAGGPASAAVANPISTTATAIALSTGGGGGVVCGAPTGGILSRPNSKWDFLDGPTSATGSATAGIGASLGAEASSAMLLALTPTSGSLTRSGVAGASLLDSASSIAMPSGMSLTGSFTSGSAYLGGAPLLRRPSSGSLRVAKDPANGSAAISTAVASISCGAGADLSGLTPTQQALLEVGMDPLLAGPEFLVYAPNGGGGGGSAALERHTSGGLSAVGSAANGSSVAPLPALNQQGGSAAVPSQRGLTPLMAAVSGGGSGGPSPVTSSDFDSVRTAGFLTPFRSSNALTPTSYRANSCAASNVLPTAPLAASVSLLDPGYGNSSGLALSPSTALSGGVNAYPSAGTPSTGAAPMRVTRASHSGMVGSRRRTDADGGAGGLLPSVPSLGGVLTAPPPALSPRVPALQALDALETAVAAITATSSVPSSPGLYSRSSRASYTGGVTPRIASVDSTWLQANGRVGFPGALRGRGPTRDGAVAVTFDLGGLTGADADAEDEAALARSLVPKNQAGMFMVRGGVSSTPAKQSASRRIAGCF